MSEETIPQMRETIDSLTTDLGKARDSENAALGQVKELTGQVIALGQGYSKAQGGLYAKVAEGDLSAEGFDSFATEQGLPQAQSNTETDSEEGSTDEGSSATDVAGSADLAKMAGGGSQAGESAGGATTKQMTRSEWQELHASDPAAAREAVAKGRVEIARDNPFGDASAVAKGTNPYGSRE